MRKHFQFLFLVLLFLLIIPMVFAGTVTRSFSSATLAPGGTLTVTLNVQPSDNDNKLVLTENILPGFEVIDAGGMSTAQTGKLKVAVLQKPTQSYTYKLKVPYQGSYTFSGTYILTTGASTAAIGGDSLFNVALSVCSSDNLNACADPTSCVTAGGSWNQIQNSCQSSGSSLKNNGNVCQIDSDCSSNHCADALAPAKPNAHKLCCALNQCSFSPEDDVCEEEGYKYSEVAYADGLGGNKICSKGVWQDFGPYCGDNVRNGQEQCDITGSGPDLNGQSCQSLAAGEGGTLKCNPTTCTFDTSGCQQAQCSNGATNYPQCDTNASADLEKLKTDIGNNIKDEAKIQTGSENNKPKASLSLISKIAKLLRDFFGS